MDEQLHIQACGNDNLFWGHIVFSLLLLILPRDSTVSNFCERFFVATETKMENGNVTSDTKAEVVVPHDHDVLSGRGNFVNYHAGNEHFRALVWKHKVAYVACPKPQKGQFSRMIVDEIRLLDPPGRFLKQDNVTQLWYDIGDKKALDKTRQALREGAPDLMKNLVNSDEDDDEDEPTQNDLYQVRGNTYRLQTSGIVRLVNPFLG